MPASTSTGEWVIARIGGAPVVISPTSLLLGLLIAGSWYPLVSNALGAFGTTTVLLVVVATVLGVAASVLLHELAHGLAGTLMGRRPTRYELYLWGGRTSFGPAREWTAWKDLVTSLSGPATNLLIWLIGTQVQDSARLTIPIAFTVWAVTLVNLALAVFNALPGLPLDGGYALAALVVQVTGNRRLGLKVAGWGGLIVVGGVVWWWILRPLLLEGRQPDAFNLILVVMVGWSIAASSWQVLELGGGARAASRLDLRELARPVHVVRPDTPLSRARDAIAGGAALVLVADGTELVGAIDESSLKELGMDGAQDPASGVDVTAGQVCTVLPAAAVTTDLTGQAAADAMKRAREVSRWLVLVDSRTLSGAVPTGAR
ncbi:peptidase M50 [Actinomyces viscosus]|uniref:Zn-dependent proteases n=1 Tax=Actinomyces viscosus TaxID=1656 RepID=A0A448PJ69_ACTVI|nr:peptidase M50 [Actinomyces viscosus]VEI15011.1 Zn-dependent proteases [Actinomyces viscosus]